jgi:hypothetical protein
VCIWQWSSAYFPSPIVESQFDDPSNQCLRCPPQSSIHVFARTTASSTVLPVNHLMVLSEASLLECTVTTASLRLHASHLKFKWRADKSNTFFVPAGACYVTHRLGQRSLNHDATISSWYMIFHQQLISCPPLSPYIPVHVFITYF